MTSRRPTAGAGKKPRWSTAQKAAHKKSTGFRSSRPARDADRRGYGDDRREGARPAADRGGWTARADRPERPGARGGRPDAAGDRREERGERRWDGPRERDGRPDWRPRSDRPHRDDNRDNRSERFERRDERRSGDWGGARRSEEGRGQDRGGARYGSERPRGERTGTDRYGTDRYGHGNDRYRNDRDRNDRNDRNGRDRSDRAGAGSGREGYRGDRANGERSGGYGARRGYGERSGYGERGGYGERRGGDGDRRGTYGERSGYDRGRGGYGERREGYRPSRDDRGGRGSGGGGGGYGGERRDRDRYGDRPGYGRADHAGAREERDHTREERDQRRSVGSDEGPRQDRVERAHRREGYRDSSGPRERDDYRRPGRDVERRPDPEAKRLRAAERPVVETVEVAPDNAFAALGVPDALVRRLARDGITAPFPIQAATIPDGLAGRDVLGRGRTGSGKTLAFGLPMLARLADGGRASATRPRALVLVPTRELAMQVSDALQPLVHVLGLRHKLVAGGMPYPPQIEALERGVDVLIATPGRLADLVERGAAVLDAVEIVVLDEADHMAEMGFLEDVTEFLDQVPAGGQRLLFSATLDRGIDGLVERYLVDPVTHSTDDGQAAVTTMDHHILLVEPAHKKLITADVANRTGRTVVFVRTKLGADRVAQQLREQGVFAAALHGGLNQGARNRVLSAFKSGELPVLVATDVAARGIHVDDVSVVLQVDPPADHKDYLHRAGRTARAGEAGTVVTLALPHQRRTMERIADQAGLGISPVRVSVGDDTILEATGARRPSGVPIPEERLRRLLDPPRRGRPGPGRRGPGRGPSGGGHGGGYGARRRPGPRPQGA